MRAGGEQYEIFAYRAGGARQVYGKYDTAIRLLFKFAAAFLIFLSIRNVLGQTAAINHPLILLILAAGCMLLPSNTIILVAAGLILVHFYGISLEAALVGGGILIIGLLVYFSLAPQSAWPLLLTGACAWAENGLRAGSAVRAARRIAWRGWRSIWGALLLPDTDRGKKRGKSAVNCC